MGAYNIPPRKLVHVEQSQCYVVGIGLGCTGSAAARQSNWGRKPDITRVEHILEQTILSGLKCSRRPRSQIGIEAVKQRAKVGSTVGGEILYC